MTEKKQIAANILKAQSELEQALSTLEKMPAFNQGEVAFSAHELKNYLTVAGCTADLLLLSLTDHPDPQIRNWLDALGHVIKLMHHTTRQLMTSSESKGAEFRFMKWDSIQLVKRACNYYQHIADRKNISILFSSAMGISPVWTDPAAAAAVLDNLLANAVKYSFPGKKIWVEMRGELENAVCSIRDEGPGISSEDQAKLFQRGAQLNSVPTGGEPSSGYGLAVAKELIDKLGGDIWCESTLGAGACFSFSLPYYEEKK